MRLRPRLLRLLPCLALGAALVASAPAAADGMAEAKEHFKKGQTHYALGEFTEAIGEFRDAYRLRDEPAILFNIAQAMRQLGQLRQAQFHYSQYLARRPDASNRADVQQLMDQMRRKADAQEEAERSSRAAEAARSAAARPPEPAAASAPGGPAAVVVDPVAAVPTVPAAPPVPSSSVAPAPGATWVQATPGEPAAPPPAPVAALRESSPAPLESLRPGSAPSFSARRTLRYAGLGAIGAGVVAEGLSLLFHASAQGSADELSSKYQGGTLKPSDSALQDNVSSKGRLSTVAAVSGAVLIAAGSAFVLVF